jgi:hypothetical protein
MKIKTQDLAGAALDWAVAQANHHDEWSDDGLKPLRWYDISDNEAERRSYEPSDDWLHGGPIIERELIHVSPEWHNQVGVTNPTWEKLGYASASGYHWRATYQLDGRWHDGPTPLIAAMRCFVASELGDEVDVPDELAGDAS